MYTYTCIMFISVVLLVGLDDRPELGDLLPEAARKRLRRSYVYICMCIYVNIYIYIYT